MQFKVNQFGLLVLLTSLCLISVNSAQEIKSPSIIQTQIIVKDTTVDKDGKIHARVAVTAPIELYVEVENSKKPITGTGATCVVSKQKEGEIEKDGKKYVVTATMLDCGREGKMLVQGILF